MRLAKTDVIAGLDAATARDLARELRLTKRQSDIEAVVPGGAATLRALQAEGYLRLDELRSSPGDPWWGNTVAGNALAQASFSRPIARATAERLLGEVLDRARRWNADPRPLVDIDEIVVFGSYLDASAQALGDLDLAVVLSSRLPADLDPDENTAASMCSTTSSRSTSSQTTIRPAAAVNDGSGAPTRTPWTSARCCVSWPPRRCLPASEI